MGSLPMEIVRMLTPDEIPGLGTDKDLMAFYPLFTLEQCEHTIVSPKTGNSLRCSREYGHDGYHAICNRLKGLVLYVWEIDEEHEVNDFRGEKIVEPTLVPDHLGNHVCLVHGLMADDICQVKEEVNEYYCTKPKDHPGVHCAHSTGDFALMVWP